MPGANLCYMLIQRAAYACRRGAYTPPPSMLIHLPPPPALASRLRSFSAVVQDGALKTVNLEEGGELTCSLSNQILDQLKQ